MKLIEVNDALTQNAFNDVAKRIYSNDSNWTCPLDVEMNGIFNPKNNRCFQHGEAIRWVLEDDNGNLIGRIAAFYDNQKVNLSEVPTGGIGFFECINDKEAAFCLFDKGKEWLLEKGMQAMNGPINFGENFVYWGLLVKGYLPQGIGMPYNHPYYQELFESYGFQNYFNQLSYHSDITKPYPERLINFVNHIGSKPNFSFDHFSYKQQDKFVNNIVDLYNTIWADFHEDYTQLKHEDIYQMINDLKPIIKEDLIWIAYDEGKPIAFMVLLPDVNQILRKLKNGKLTLINKLKFLYHKKMNTINRGRLIISGVVPDQQKTGIVGAIYLKMVDAAKLNGYKEVELSWVGDYNITVGKIYKQMGAEDAKMHTTYRYLFDRNLPFKRFTNEHSNKMQKLMNRTNQD